MGWNPIESIKQVITFFVCLLLQLLHLMPNFLTVWPSCEKRFEWKHFAILTLWTAQFRFCLGIFFVWVTVPCELPESYSLLIRQKEHTMTYTKKVKRWHFPVALEFSFVAQRNGSSLLSMFSNQLFISISFYFSSFISTASWFCTP